MLPATKSQLYGSYKSLSTDLFVPVELKEKRSAGHFLRTAQKFEKCAAQRIEMRDTYYTNRSDIGHEIAIQQATKQSKTSLDIYRVLLTKSIMERQPGKVCEENTYQYLENKSPTLNKPALDIFKKNKNVDSQSFVKSSTKTDDDILEDAFEESTKERIYLTILIFDIICKKTKSDPDLVNYHHGFVLCFWMFAHHIPLRVLDFTKLLKDTSNGSFYNQIKGICTQTAILTDIKHDSDLREKHFGSLPLNEATKIFLFIDSFRNLGEVMNLPDLRKF